ncbi:transglycosylase domain-containing protein [Sporomusa sphaeroides]|uniref:Penicillin-binding protein 1F n=2 Tax=Sporomusa TaxID=2375 RepID=A0ABP2C4T0_9FIRM|nr:penicillin-binding protein 1A [Sporomusa sphaeroides]OLS58432.1 penicillin-binding protein 1F [Sporomusa sphaeroides DSM 2875]CVK17380.1 Penicillin-binding protein 1F [Sporomusa sphaeroides DSM 2875]SCM80208.1 Penicillin-binding protein 1F [uncultured Sporomusa sp.]
MQDKNNENKESGRRRPKKNFRAVTIIAILVFLVMLTGASLGFLTASIHTIPSLKGEIRPAVSSQIFDVNGKLITTIHSVENRLPVSINKIPKNLQNAFIAAEDVRFYQHSGIDPRGILRAIWSNITNRGIAEGGSTITQQLARNALLSQDQTIKRKIQEAFLSLQIERQYSKQEILEMYMNQIYFGQGAYGVQTAAQIYFGKNVEDLNLAECAMIAGIPKSPNYYSPSSNLKAAKERQSVVLDQLVKYDYIDSATALKAKNTEIKLVNRNTTTTATASYFTDYVLQLLIEKYGADAVYKDGLKVYTSLDIEMQTAAEQAMNQLLPTRRTENGIKQPQGALVAIDPHNGHIKAMVGGRGNDQFNRAVLAERQPGSAFKPFVYLAALESGFTPASIIDDKPISFGSWSPMNYDRRFRGPVTMRTALEQSLNVVTVKLAQQVGIDKTLYYAQQMGISTLVLTGNTNDRNLAMSLGGLTRGVTPLEIASAYGVLANGGVRVEPLAIIKVVDRNGKVIEETLPRERVVVNERSAYLLTDMLRGAINQGTGAGAYFGRPAAGKTGTTSDYKDAWFVGYTPDLAAAVWMGYDNADYLSGITGGTIPATIWQSFMREASTKYVARDFVKPSGIVTARISTQDGLLLNDAASKEARDELFAEGTQPTKVSTVTATKDDNDKKDGKDNAANNDGKNPAQTGNTEGSDTTEQIPPPPPAKNSKNTIDPALPPPPPKPTDSNKKN